MKVALVVISRRHVGYGVRLALCRSYAEQTPNLWNRRSSRDWLRANFGYAARIMDIGNESASVRLKGPLKRAVLGWWSVGHLKIRGSVCGGE
jgi:hypothetical protein